MKRNKKRFFGEVFSVLGSPPVTGALGIYSCLVYRSKDKLATLFWSVPLTLTTLPLFPFYLLGEEIIKKEDQKEFDARTKSLERVTLPQEYAYITPADGLFLVEPFYMEGEEDPFDSEADARLFLQCLHYKEVLSNDTERLITFWIKDDAATRSETF